MHNRIWFNAVLDENLLAQIRLTLLKPMQGLSGVQGVLKSESVPHHGCVPYVSVIFQSFAIAFSFVGFTASQDLAHVTKSAIAHS